MLAGLGVYLELRRKLYNILQVPIHLRTNWDSFYLEMLMLAGLGVYFLSFLYLELCSKLPLWESVIVLCFVVRYFMSILVLQSS